MLSALLPGVREFRTPLVTGLLWAACLWLLIGMPVAESPATTDFITSFALDTLPPTIWFAAAALLVYLVGSPLVVRASPVELFARRFRPWAAREIARLDGHERPQQRLRGWVWKVWADHSWRPVFRPLRNLRNQVENGGQRWESVDGWLHNEFQSMVADGRVPVMRSFEGGCSAPSGFEGFYATETVDLHPAYVENYELRSSLVETFVREVKQEKAAVEVRIQMRFPEVYAEIDRLKVEAELRMSTFWPLVTLIGILAFAWSPLALLAVVVPPLLLRDGFQRLREASEKTWGALVAGEVTSPILDAMASTKDAECRDFRTRYRGQDVGDEDPPSVQAVS